MGKIGGEDYRYKLPVTKYISQTDVIYSIGNTVNSLHTIQELCMVTNSNWAYEGDHFIMSKNMNHCVTCLKLIQHYRPIINQ